MHAKFSLAALKKSNGLEWVALFLSKTLSSKKAAKILNKGPLKVLNTKRIECFADLTPGNGVAEALANDVPQFSVDALTAVTLVFDTALIDSDGFNVASAITLTDDCDHFQHSVSVSDSCSRTIAQWRDCFAHLAPTQTVLVTGPKQEQQQTQSATEVYQCPRATPDELFAFLQQHGIELLRTEWHEAVFTCAAADALDLRLEGAHCKNLFLKERKGNKYFLLSAVDDSVVRIGDLHKVLGAIDYQGPCTRPTTLCTGCKALRFANEDDLVNLLGVTRGAVTPFAVLNDAAAGRVTLLLDERFRTLEKLNFHPLVNTGTCTIARDSFLRFCTAAAHEPVFVILGEPDNAE
ncbi:MAG: hypothetical protein MHM6MM_000728 [Cercozoa sp. M6MM]